MTTSPLCLNHDQGCLAPKMGQILLRGLPMRSLAPAFQPLAVALGLVSLACLSTGDVLGAVGELIPMGTSGLSGLNPRQPGPPVSIGTSHRQGEPKPVVEYVNHPANYPADEATSHTDPGFGTAACGLGCPGHLQPGGR